METILRTHLGKNSLAVAAIFFAAMASTSIARGQYTWVKNITGAGGSPGYFTDPVGVAVSASGQVYVGDTGTEFQAFNSNGVYQFTSTGANPMLSEANGVAVSPVTGLIYVANSLNGGGIEEFSSSGQYQLSFGTSQLNYARGVGVDANGNIYGVNTNGNSVLVFNSSGVYQNSLSGTSLSQPWGIAFGPNGNIYVANAMNDRIAVFNSSGVYQSSFGTAGSGNGDLNFPSNVAVSANGNVYVADQGNGRIEEFNSNGQYVTCFGSPGSGNGQFNSPTGVAVSPTGEIFVADSNNKRIEKFFALNEWVSGSPHFDTAAVGYGQLLGASLTMNANQGLQVDGAMTIQAGGSLTTLGGNITAGSFTNSGTYSVNGGTVSVTGNPITLVNNGTMTLNGGAVSAGLLMNNATLTLNGGNVLGSLTNYYGASMTANGSVAGNFVNQGTLTQSGPLSVGGGFTNLGTATIAAGGQLLPAAVTNTGTVNVNGGAIVDGGTFTNESTVNVNGGSIVSTGNFLNYGLVALNGGLITSGGGNFTNLATGAIRGDGTIAIPLTNQGGLIYATGGNGLTVSSFAANQGGGQLCVADGDSLTVWAQIGSSFTNESSIVLQGPNAAFNGSTIVNFGTISGQGRITDTITNYGTVTASGGQLALAGPANYNQGSIESAAGTSIVDTQGLASNNGLIALTGGSFDNSGNTMSNGGSILGNGSFSTGGLTNVDTVTLSDGNSSIFGPVINASGGTITTMGTSATVISFYGAVTNSSTSAGGKGGVNPPGYIYENGITVRYLGGYSGGGILIADPSTTYFTGLAVGTSGLVQGGAGDQFFVTAPCTNAGTIDLGGNSSMLVQNGGTLTQTSGVLEVGASGTLTAGAVEINGGTLLADGRLATITASLLYASPSASTYQGILAGAGKSLTLDNPAALLILSGSSNSYTGGTYVEAGTLEITSAGAVPGGTSLTVGNGGAFVFDPSLAAAPVANSAAAAAVPEPGTLVLLAAGALGLLGYGLRRHRAARPAKPSTLHQQDAPAILSFPSHSSQANAARRAA